MHHVVIIAIIVICRNVVFVLFHNVTCNTHSLLSRIHVNSRELLKITCALIARSVIL